MQAPVWFAVPMSRLVRWLAALILCLALPAQADWQALGSLERSGARVSAQALDLGNGATLEQLNADTRLTPASLTKLVVAAAALDTWPADKTFQTRLLGTGAMSGGVIAGDLILNGLGDATLDHQALWLLAVQLKAAGISAISGGLVVNTSPFGELGCETQDRCDALKRSGTAYNAPIAAIGVDYGNWCVDVRAADVGAPAVVVGCSVAQLPVPVQGTVKTVSAGGRTTLWVDRSTTPQGDIIRVGGNIAAGDGQSVYRAMSDPALGTGLLLAETLREIGIRIGGAVSVSHAAVPQGAYLMAAVEGLSLKEQLGRMLRFSNNYIADVLTLNLAAAANGKAPVSLAEAGKALSNFLARGARGGRRGAGGSAPPLFSGSGLTPENEISADELTGLLASQYYNTRNFPAYYGGLVVPRQAPFVFLRNGSPAWLDRVALKTGTMDDPHSVCGVAGYLRKKDGGWIAFTAMVNGGPRMKHVPLYKAMEAIRADIDSLLTRY